MPDTPEETRQIRYVLTPWKVALWGTGTGLLFSVLFALFPPLRNMPLPGDRALPLHQLLLAVSIVASAWAVAGIFRRERDGNLFWCLFSLMLASFSVAFVGITLWRQSGTL